MHVTQEAAIATGSMYSVREFRISEISSSSRGVTEGLAGEADVAYHMAGETLVAEPDFSEHPAGCGVLGVRHGDDRIEAEHSEGVFTDVFNVEATAVAETETGYLFIWAERNSGQQSTEINWTELKLAPFAIGPGVSSVEFQLPKHLVNSRGDPLYSRPVVGISVDAAGRIYTVAAFDPEGTVPDPDDGPFRSAVFEIGQVRGEMVEIDPEPTLLGTMDGIKVESVAVRELDGEIEHLIGTDDENSSYEADLAFYRLTRRDRDYLTASQH